jgi:hypothetical protein
VQIYRKAAGSFSNARLSFQEMVYILKEKPDNSLDASLSLFQNQRFFGKGPVFLKSNKIITELER